MMNRWIVRLTFLTATAPWKSKTSMELPAAASPTKPNVPVRTEAEGNQENSSIPVVKEELQVGKRAVQRGAVRVYSRLMQQPVEEKISLREEHVNVDRVRPIGLPRTRISGQPIVK